MLAGNFPATFSVEGVGDWRRGMTEILDFGGVKEGGGTSFGFPVGSLHKQDMRSARGGAAGFFSVFVR